MAKEKPLPTSEDDIINHVVTLMVTKISEMNGDSISNLRATKLAKIMALTPQKIADSEAYGVSMEDMASFFHRLHEALDESDIAYQGAIANATSNGGHNYMPFHDYSEHTFRYDGTRLPAARTSFGKRDEYNKNHDVTMKLGVAVKVKSKQSPVMEEEDYV